MLPSTTNSKLSTLNESSVFGEKMELVSAQNAKLLLTNENGETKEYLDFMSAYGSVNFGHCNPNIQPFTDLKADIAACFYPREANDFAQWLCDYLDLPNHCVLYQVGGSFAVSTALALAHKIKPGKILAIEGAFHGLGLDSLSITTAQKDMALHNSELLSEMESHVMHLKQGDIPTNWDDISCIIYEPIQGANGYVPLDIDWLSKLEEIAHENGVITIADEIQCGFFRHGSLSPARSNGLNPDILLYSKSMTNGLFPFSAVVYPVEFEKIVNMKTVLAHTFQNSALGCYAAKKVADYIDQFDVYSDINRINMHFSQLAIEIESFSNVSDIFVTGPSLSFEVTDNKAKELVQRCLSQGVLLFTGGVKGQRVRIAPPITIPQDQLEYGSNIILNCLVALKK